VNFMQTAKAIKALQEDLAILRELQRITSVVSDACRQLFEDIAAQQKRVSALGCSNEGRDLKLAAKRLDKSIAREVRHHESMICDLVRKDEDLTRAPHDQRCPQFKGRLTQTAQQAWSDQNK